MKGRFTNTAQVKVKNHRLRLPSNIMKIIGDEPDQYRLVTSPQSLYASISKVDDAIEYFEGHYQSSAKPLSMSIDGEIYVNVNLAFANASQLIVSGLGDYFEICTIAEHEKAKARLDQFLAEQYAKNPYFDMRQLLDSKP